MPDLYVPVLILPLYLGHKHCRKKTSSGDSSTTPGTVITSRFRDLDPNPLCMPDWTHIKAAQSRQRPIATPHHNLKPPTLKVQCHTPNKGHGVHSPTKDSSVIRPSTDHTRRIPQHLHLSEYRSVRLSSWGPMCPAGGNLSAHVAHWWSQCATQLNCGAFVLLRWPTWTLHTGHLPEGDFRNRSHTRHKIYQ